MGKFDDLVDQQLLTREQLQAAIAEAKKLRSSVETVLINRFQVSRSDIGASIGLFYRCPFVSLDTRIDVEPRLLKGLSVHRLRAGCWFPMRCDDEAITIVMRDPHDLPEVDYIERLFHGKRIVLVAGLPDEIQRLIELSFQGSDTKSILGEADNLASKAEDDGVTGDGIEVSDNDATIIRLAHQIIIDAHRSRASDIHIEPCHLRKQTIVRFRIDGTCTEYERIPQHLGKPLLSRFKIMAHLDIAERRKPQDGKLRVRLPEREVELRIAVIPTVGGNEDAIMRLLPAQGVTPLDDQGLSARNVRELKTMAEKPYGLILCVGPTGSGKTTMLHAILNHINTPERKIWTAEDPVEITQSGLRQVQIRPNIGYTFAAAMRAFLRGDPDVIMVGEIRDPETAAIAIEGSLTGHLVLSTLHTNSAAETIVRLLDLGLDPFNFSDALLGVLAQRLVKRLCEECTQPYVPHRNEIEELAQAYGAEEWAGLDLGLDDPPSLHQGKGCSRCNYTGFWGRTAIHELLVSSDEIKSMIATRQGVPKILAQARREGLTTLVQDGVLKVLNGITDFRQVKSAAIR